MSCNLKFRAKLETSRGQGAGGKKPGGMGSYGGQVEIITIKCFSSTISLRAGSPQATAASQLRRSHQSLHTLRLLLGNQLRAGR